MTESDNDTNAARARAWPFTSRASMMPSAGGGTDAYTLVFWPGNKFHPPPEVDVSEYVQYLRGDMLREQLSKYMGIFDAAVSFALPIWPSTSDGIYESTAEVVVDKVLQYVG